MIIAKTGYAWCPEAKLHLLQLDSPIFYKGLSRIKVTWPLEIRTEYCIVIGCKHVLYVAEESKFSDVGSHIHNWLGVTYKCVWMQYEVRLLGKKYSLLNDQVRVYRIMMTCSNQGNTRDDGSMLAHTCQLCSIWEQQHVGVKYTFSVTA